MIQTKRPESSCRTLHCVLAFRWYQNTTEIFQLHNRFIHFCIPTVLRISHKLRNTVTVASVSIIFNSIIIHPKNNCHPCSCTVVENVYFQNHFVARRWWQSSWYRLDCQSMWQKISCFCVNLLTLHLCIPWFNVVSRSNHKLSRKLWLFVEQKILSINRLSSKFWSWLFFINPLG